MEFHGEIYYTGYVIIIGDYILSQFDGVTAEDFCYVYYFSYHIQIHNPQFRKYIRHRILLPKSKTP